VLDRGFDRKEKRRHQLDDLLVQRQTEIEAWSEQTGELERDSPRSARGPCKIAGTLGVAQEQVEKIRTSSSGWSARSVRWRPPRLRSTRGPRRRMTN